MARLAPVIAALLLLPASASARWGPRVSFGGANKVVRGAALSDGGQLAILYGKDAELRVARGPIGSRLPRRRLLSRSAAAPQVRVLDDGRTVVAWSEQGSGDAVLPMAASARRDGTFGPRFATAQAAGTLVQTRVDASGFGVSAYRDDLGVLEVVRWHADGRVEAPQAVGTPGPFGKIGLALAGDRRTIVTWCDGKQDSPVLYAKARGDRPLGSAHVIDGARCFVDNAVAVAEEGAAVATWYAPGGAAQMSLRAPGGEFGPAQPAGSSGVDYPLPAAGRSHVAVVLAGSLLSGTADRVAIDGGAPETLPSGYVGEPALDRHDRLTYVDRTIRGSFLWTRVAAGRWRRERLPVDYTDAYRSSRAGRIDAGSDFVRGVPYPAVVADRAP